MPRRRERMPPKITLGGPRKPKEAGGAPAARSGARITLGGPRQRRPAQPKGAVAQPSKHKHSLVVHPTDFSAEQLLINPVAFPELTAGDLVRVYHPPSSDQPEEGREALLQVVEGTLVKDADGSKGIRWFSILDSVADFFELRPRAEVAIEAVGKDNTSKYEVKFITVRVFQPIFSVLVSLSHFLSCWSNPQLIDQFPVGLTHSDSVPTGELQESIPRER